MFTLVNKDNISEYSTDVREAELLYFHNEADSIRTAIMDNRLNYVVYKDDGIIGGAKITNIDQHHELTRYFKDNGYKLDDCWIIEEVFFHAHDDMPIHDNPEQFDAACHKFYQGLYDAIKLIGIQQNKTALITLNPIEEHEDIKHFGQWPFTMQYTLQGKNKILGILPLENQQVGAA